MHIAGRRPFFKVLDVKAKIITQLIALGIWLATEWLFFGGFDSSVPGGVLTWILFYLAGVTLTVFSPLGRKLTMLTLLITFLLLLFLIRLKTTESIAARNF